MANSQKQESNNEAPSNDEGSVSGAHFNEQPGRQEGGKDGINETLQRAGLGVAELDPTPQHAADKSSAPGPYDQPLHRPPLASPRPDAKLVAASAQGAGQHVPPDPKEFDAMGRVKA